MLSFSAHSSGCQLHSTSPLPDVEFRIFDSVTHLSSWIWLAPVLVAPYLSKRLFSRSPKSSPNFSLLSLVQWISHENHHLIHQIFDNTGMAISLIAQQHTFLLCYCHLDNWSSTWASTFHLHLGLGASSNWVLTVCKHQYCFYIRENALFQLNLAHFNFLSPCKYILPEIHFCFMWWVSYPRPIAFLNFGLRDWRTTTYLFSISCIASVMSVPMP